MTKHLIIPVAILFVLAGSIEPTLADITLTITGDDSDTIVEWSLEGSVTVNQSIGSENNNDLLFPTLEFVRWDHLANVGTDGIVSSTTIGHASISGSPTISINGGSNLFAGVGLNNFAFFDDPSGDSFQILYDGFALHPALSNGDTVTYSGSGAVNLGAPKSSVFANGFHVGEQLIHSTDRINLFVRQVPEPSMLWGLGLVSTTVFIRRRRSCLK